MRVAMQPKLDEAAFRVRHQEFRARNEGRFVSKFLASFVSEKQDRSSSRIDTVNEY
jgi:hypothetical protein